MRCGFSWITIRTIQLRRYVVLQSRLNTDRCTSWFLPPRINLPVLLITRPQKVPCTFTLDVPHLGYLDNAPTRPLASDTTLSLPLYMAQMLAISTSAQTTLLNLSLPPSLSQNVLNALKASPRSVDLDAQAKNFYALGARMLDLFEEDEILDVLSETFRTRASDIGDFAGSVGGGSGIGSEGVEFLRGLDQWEKALFKGKHDAVKAIKRWMEQVGQKSWLCTDRPNFVFEYPAIEIRKSLNVIFLRRGRMDINTMTWLVLSSRICGKRVRLPYFWFKSRFSPLYWASRFDGAMWLLAQSSECTSLSRGTNAILETVYSVYHLWLVLAWQAATFQSTPVCSIIVPGTIPILTCGNNSVAREHAFRTIHVCWKMLLSHMHTSGCFL